MRDKVFISYRRDDARHPAARLYDRMARRFGRTRVFMDVDTIHHGFDFRRVLEGHLARTKVMLVVIGPGWADVADATGRRRLDDPDDFVRMEIAEALRSAPAVIPVRVDGAQMPRAEDLPEDIADLRFRQSVELRPDDFANDVGVLEKSVAAILSGRAGVEGALGSERPRRLWPWAAGAVAAGLAVAAFFAADFGSNAPSDPRPASTTSAAPSEEAAADADEARPAAAGFEARLLALPQGEALAECDACPEMVAIPAGDFLMGSPENEDGRYSDEGPQREVTVERFAIGRYEITFDQWAACVADNYCQSNPNPDDEGWGRGDRPVINVSWNDITGERGFIDWLNSKVKGAPYRLPSEAEWEYAARAGSSARFSFGDSDAALGDHAWYGSNSGSRTHPVGEKQPNAFGLYDVHGNVWEWVQDCWHGSYNGAPSDGSAWMNASEGDCSYAVLRGGSWNDSPRYLRSAIRSRDRRENRYNGIGFRVARTLRD